MLKITDDNYDEYSPIVILSNWEKRSKSIAKKGLKVGLTDVVTDLMGQPADIKSEINDYLVSQGLLGFNHLVSIVKNVTEKALKRGKLEILMNIIL